MSSSLLIIGCVLLACGPVRAQNWTVGVPVHDTIPDPVEIFIPTSEVFMTCDTFTISWHNQAFPVDGIDHIWIVGSVSPPDRVFYDNLSGAEVLAGDTVWMPTPGPGLDLVFNDSAYVVMRWEMFGTPTTAGQPHICSTSMPYFASIFPPCAISRGAGWTDPCMTQAPSAIDEAGSLPMVQMPTAGNGWRLGVDRTSAIELMDVHGRKVREVSSGRSMDCGGMEPGVYLFRVRSGTGHLRLGRILLGVN